MFFAELPYCILNASVFIPDLQPTALSQLTECFHELSYRSWQLQYRCI